jgi:hypothetical protein
MTDELISRTTRGLFRSLMTGSTLGEIATAFQDEGIARTRTALTKTPASGGRRPRHILTPSTGAIRGTWPGRCGHSSG